ncbi:hypothetical protein N1851_015949 [Merluccius polli]|uniref:Uncharacterized protein n=1 Tax=Merluccius polli TaxID=89951 RepID=A0AA47P285_MERPO|nr:hypothetical protein N1851_015949 [Merluccius polli]
MDAKGLFVEGGVRISHVFLDSEHRYKVDMVSINSRSRGPAFARLVEQSHGQLRENGRDQTVLMISLTTSTSSQTSTVSAAKSAFYQTKINSSASNPRKLFSMFSSLLTPSFPPLLSPPSLTADDIVTYFTKKVKDISSSFTPATILPPPTPTSVGLTRFTPLSSEDVHKLPPINSFLTSGLISAPFKTARVKMLLKKSTLDTADIRNYRPARGSKLTEAKAHTDPSFNLFKWERPMRMPVSVHKPEARN